MKEKILLDDIEDAYKKIGRYKTKYGTYKKTLFHLHTPASYDYRLLECYKDSKTYKNITADELLFICKKKKIISRDFDINKDLQKKIIDKYYDSKELLSYLILAYELVIREYEIILVSDHNTILGIDKLRQMLLIMYNSYGKLKKYPEIIRGIEFSCADKIHVVAIFDEDKINIIENILKEHLISEDDGIMLTSYILMELLTQQGCLAYMAHLNSADIFKDDKFLSGGYKERLLKSSFANIVGIHNIDNKDVIQTKMKQLYKKNIHFLIDNDSHFIETLNENYFWIKGQNVNFQMIKEAFIDFDIAISYEKKHIPEKYVKGFFIKYKENGFLKGKNINGKTNVDFCMQLSPSLNCFIGGRGTGKSTVLQLLDYALGQNCNTKDLLKFLSNHGNIYILYNNKGIEYMIVLYLSKELIKHILNDSLIMNGYNKQKIKDIIRKQCIDVYKVKKENIKIIVKKETTTSKYILLDKFYDTRYSVNELVSTASDNKICEFIFNMMFKTLAHISDEIKENTKNGLINLLDNLSQILKQRKEIIDKKIKAFNDQNLKNLYIKYEQKKQYYNFPFGIWIDITYLTNKYNITEDAIIGYLEAICNKIGLINMLRLGLNLEYKYKKIDFSIIGYTSEWSKKFVDEGKIRITIKNEQEVINFIFNNLVIDRNINSIIKYLKRYLNEIEIFKLMFNINSKESKRSEQPVYKDVRELSLGQKVVAMLDFILAYAKFLGDNRPLIIDQPEDNLDSRYIYKHLVKQLRSVKDNRQVILATHNATIVTNTMTENVCVMESDGIHGWIETTGYPGNIKMKRNIITYMEGGIESFNHKIQIYKEALK